MSVDFDAIARAGRCDVSSLRLALPLLEQGYTPPFLARYRRDELSGIDEASLWALSSAVKAERELAIRRDELTAAWEQTTLRDPAIGLAISKAHSDRVLSRLARRLKSETSDAVDDSARLASRILNPQKGDGDDFAEIANKVEGIADPTAAVAGLDQAIATRLMGDPRIISAATRWLAKNARIHIENISDPHGESDVSESAGKKKGKQGDKERRSPGAAVAGASGQDAAHADAVNADVDAATTEASSADVPNTELSGVDSASADATGADASASDAASSDAASTDVRSTDVRSTDVRSTDVRSTDVRSTDVRSTDVPSTDVPSTDVPSADVPSADVPSADVPSAAAPTAETVTKTAAKSKKVSPRQRRRRWLVSVLKPLSGKRFKSDKLSAFQIVMLGRALRSQVAKCAFEYDATKLVAEIQHTAIGINRPIEAKIRQLVLEYEANIREAAEAAWWDDLAERATARLVNVTADHLSRHVNRGGVGAKVVMSIDAVGPRTAAAAIVASDGRLLHSEDIPCQLSSAQRSQAVNKMGELIHNHHVDLIVISNGPARRATMIALGELIKQSPEKSIHWTLADRSGADAYSGSPSADQEMRSTPRRFRAAAWLAFSILQPAQALSKVDPLKLRLSSFQRELADEAILGALEDILISGASRGGVDANSAPVSWLARLPGMTTQIAKAIDQSRRESLFASREAIAELDQWESVVQSRQAIPFLRVFGSEQVLDGTLVHPDDYPLAQKLAKSLEIELPPNAPPGYQPKPFDADTDPTVPARLSEVEAAAKPIPVRDFTSAASDTAEFQLPETESTSATEDVAADRGIAETEATEQTDPPEVEIQQATESDEKSESEPAPASDASNIDIESEPPSPQASEEESATPSRPPESFKRPIPERAKIAKCVKEWQIGSNRAQQIVHWLCDPFGDSDVSGSPPAVMSNMPTTKGLKPGDQVIGVVVSVMPFGVFVELAPDCSGLVHVSRISESFIEDLHEAVQIGDVVSAWVIGIDEKRRRVALSAISPQRAQQLDEQRRDRSERGPRNSGPGQRGGSQRGAAQRGTGPTQTGTRNQATGNRPAAAGTAGSQGGRGKPQGSPAQGKSRDSRPGKERQPGRTQGGARGGRSFERKPESYRVETKKDLKPITEEMQKGKEPMRSFGDLIQFFGKDKGADKVVNDSEKPESVPNQAAALPVTEQSVTDEPVTKRPATEPTDDSTPSPPEPVAQAASSDAPTPDTSESDTPGS